ncbi:MAG: zinc ribbon domain-containing protein [Candidatus Edwardsbacteria bacterium]|jgi:putative FmdB family regulatory protein|nr:zinc ribbon domain-containing protein [Candidatus Edwardsbacteria bacterium]
MPIYEYQCASCGHRFERLMSSSSVKAPACPRCGKATEKQLSAFAAKAGSACCSGSEHDSGGSCCSGGTCGCH